MLFSFSFSLFLSSFCHAGNMHIGATHLAPDRCNSAAWCNKATPHCVTVLCWGPAALCQTGTLTHLHAVQLHGVEAGATRGGFQSCSTAHLDALDPVVALLSAQPSLGKDLGPGYTGATGPPSQCRVRNLVSARSPAALGLMSTPVPAAPACFFPVLVYSKVTLTLGGRYLSKPGGARRKGMSR